MNKCILCGSTNYLKLFDENNHSIFRCVTCGLVITGDATKKINYKKYHRDEDYKSFESMFENIFQKRFNIISNYNSGKRVLDIGASTGTMLGIFKKNGWETWGVEPSTSANMLSEKVSRSIKTTFEKANIEE